MKNKYEIRGDATAIFLKKRNGKILETLIDTHNLQRLLDFGYTWHAAYQPDIDSYYARCTKYKGTFNGKPKYEMLYLHRFLTNAEKGDYVDHVSHEALDNRECNLEIKTNRENILNRLGANRNNKTGYRNVSYIKAENKYIVQLMINGKNTRLGKFDDVHEAGKFAEEMREKYYGQK